jgi:hypothetical protein
MMRYAILLLVLTLAVFGCARDPASPPTSATEGAFASGDSGSHLTSQAPDGPHRLWGEWSIFIDETHTKVDVVPRRQGRFHLNALRFLEDHCKDCLQITYIHNNGDGTIDLTVRITHPFPGHPEFTGFDVKGIIMFDGSHEIPFESMFCMFPDTKGDADGWAYFHISWRELGDPEVLNPDGYSVHWSPWWPSDSEKAIFNYWPGKYSSGTPTANINAYLFFYTDLERHMFRVNGKAERTYHISLPPGPVVAGYAVEACWQPPLVTPVVDPLSDFPLTANQDEAYYFRFILNNNEPITDDICCNDAEEGDCSRIKAEFVNREYGEVPNEISVSYPPYPTWWQHCTSHMPYCDQTPPPGVIWLHPHDYAGMNMALNYPEDGNYRGVAVLCHGKMTPPNECITYTVFDFTMDLE